MPALSTITRFYGAAQVAALDRRVIDEFGIPGFDLMHRAADAGFQALRGRWPEADRLAVVCGPGNNGGDGFLIAARGLASAMTVRVWFPGDPERLKGDAHRAYQAFMRAGGMLTDSPAEALADADVAVDALLGTGLGRPLAGDFLSAVQAINRAGEQGAGVLAVDIPSGLGADTGAIWGEAVRADVTATFIGAKLGLVTGAGPAHAGEVTLHELEAPDRAYADMPWLARQPDDAWLAAALPRRRRDAHKGDHGHVLCVGGNTGMGGAARLAAEAALRVGAGLVSVATRDGQAAAMTQARPELMCRDVAAAPDLEALLDRATVVAIGPGLGTDDWARDLLARVLTTDRPLMVDADALNLIAEGPPPSRANWIITPHPGEAGRLLDRATADVQADRPAAAVALADRFGAVAVLKGAGTLIADGCGGLWVSTAGNPGMAVGGMGDLLTGTIAGLLAQGIDLDTAAIAGVCLHGRAADRAAAGGERGLLPSDCLAPLRALVNPA
ncbi:NAD(P)H-hydrate dehydratase [Salinisphaera sp. P385]|uniref:Bifunctional NAD(P)H-hydrate repair enzyme n=1 Tax=Spectribacter acetivorans TaxID=3075603 RepID=A0ABU3B6Q5_9GAMM|nr:NAD(P)H-hydrate dehydratase [Salinisphaera sp. P385]MDT0617735.1 NAD(P)H-hydrate dehydratase [Salinisphaera sp. P385]